MKKKIISIFAIVAIIAMSLIGLTGCGSKTDNKKSIVGDWEYKNGGYISF